MSDIAREIIPVNIEDELKQSYLDYAMSVIVGRALPDVRDGLKPVHRRVLFAMHELSNDWNKPYKKSARVVGDVIGKYHPHGDGPVYDTIVRLAQPFSMRYPLVDGQGNFGSIDGDPPAAMRYTEIRMAKLSHALLADLEKETVDFAPNYDETEFAPVVLPTRVPNLLVNGSSGIAVGMATNIPPHNLTEVIDGCVAMIKNPEIRLDELMEYISGPDFPTGATINGRGGIVAAYKTGRGRIVIRAVTHIEEDKKSSRESIIVTELPYQVNKAKLIERIAELVKDKKVEGISGLRDESNKDGMRIVIELRRGEVADVVLNNLFIHTRMQTVFGINMVALVNNQPRVLSLTEVLQEFIKHRREVVTRRTIFDLRKARARAHILEGLAVALSNIDPIIDLIKAAPTPVEAKERLLSQTWQGKIIHQMLDKADSQICRPEDLPAQFAYDDVTDQYRLSPTQAQAILDLRLHRLTGLEQDKILQEYKDIILAIKDFMEILANPERLMAVITQELLEIKEQFADKRRTEISTSNIDLTIEDLITEEDMVVTLSNQDYVKSQQVSLYHAQRRGGRGKSATKVKEEDFVERLVIANSHDFILCFSNYGKVYWLKTYQIPQASRTARGRPMVNILPLQNDERITAMLPIREFEENKYVFMVSEQATVKKVSLSQFSRPRANGIIAVELSDNDRLVGVAITDGQRDILLFSDAGKVIRFTEDAVRAMGRTARGVRGMKLQAGQKIISLVVVSEQGPILTATENGYGKQTPLEEYRTTGRGGQGVISIQVTERNGKVVAAIQAAQGDEIMLISDGGTLVRTRVDEISVVGRNTQGVSLINLTNDEHLVGMQRIEDLEETESPHDSIAPVNDSFDQYDSDDFQQPDED